MKNGKLELTWVDKDVQLKLEPRVLVEDTEKSFGNPKAENMLIFGDNLLALKALEQDFSGKIKCIYIDPPFNTGAAFDHYDDNLENSIWLDLMFKRLKLLRDLLAPEGVIFVNLDDTQAAYCKVIMDEVFGRKNYINQIINATNKPFGFKSTATNLFTQANHILFYAKDRERFTLNPKHLFIEKGYDKAYRYVFTHREGEESEWRWENIGDVVAKANGHNSPAEAKRRLGEEFDNLVALYALENNKNVFRTASVSGGAYLKRKETILKSKGIKNKIVRHPGDDMDYMFIGGERVIFYSERIKEIDGEKLPGELITDIWDDISIEGLATEGGVDFPKGKKPEKLIQRCIEISTKKDDWVLDSFLGSGTTAAVAHKLGRKWIGIELGTHCNTHCLPRLKDVVTGKDTSGISKTLSWQGGGGFKFYRLAESLLVRDAELSTKEHPVFVINPRYDTKMLIRAICKIESFKYRNDGRLHGISSERRFLHVTTNLVTQGYLDSLTADLKSDQSLLVYCTRSVRGLKLPSNIEIKRIPRDLLSQCDFEEGK